jgi:hypothetical protein
MYVNTASDLRDVLELWRAKHSIVVWRIAGILQAMGSCSGAPFRRRGLVGGNSRYGRVSAYLYETIDDMPLLVPRLLFPAPTAAPSLCCEALSLHI